MKRNLWYGILALFGGTMACRPVIAIGWTEFLFFLVLILILLGPPLYRLLRRLERARRRDKNEK